MRLDKFLKLSRIIKRRTVANEACDMGRVKLNGKAAKAGSEIKIGDIIEIQMGERTNKYEILNISENVAKKDSESLYKII